MKTFLQKLSRAQHLSEEDTYEVFELLMQSSNEPIHDSCIGAYLFATAVSLPTANELVGAARSLKRHMLPVKLQASILLDTCGTGGSGFDTFNTSTAVALVLASLGIGVCKHGNRAATSRCGSADVLEALGLSIDKPASAQQRMFERHNFCFLFAPLHHPATKRVQGIRKQLGVRTIFNFLGPLVNPANPTHQLMGVSSREMLEPMALALHRLGVSAALIVCGEDGLDEISLCAKTSVVEMREGRLKKFELTPEDFGLHRAVHSEIAGGTPAEAANELLHVLQGTEGAKFDLVALNAGAALYLCGAEASIKDGVVRARAALRSASAAHLVSALCGQS